MGFKIAGGKPLLELNRVLRPGGFFIWSATPVYKKDERHRNTWECEPLSLSLYKYRKFSSLDGPQYKFQNNEFVKSYLVVVVDVSVQL